MNGQPSLSDNRTEFNVTGDQSPGFSVYNLDPATVDSILYGLCAFSVLTVLVNSFFLFLTWHIHIGSSNAILFMRCLCLGDILVGVYGIFKILLLESLDSRSINCFLPESMFISASTVHCSVLLWWNIDSYIRLAKPLQYTNITNKVSKTTVMIFLWNVASIIGVLPQIGWNTRPFVCNFFEFYTGCYIVLLNVIWSGTSVGSSVMQCLLVRKMRSICTNTSIMPSNSREYSKCTSIITIIQMDMSLWMCSYIPFLIYISIYFTNQQYMYNKHSNINLIFFLAIFMLRSFLSAIVHCYGSVRIRRVMKMIGRDLTNTESGDSGSERLSNPPGDTNLLSVTAVIHGQADKNSQMKITVSPSDMTILEEGPQDGIDNQAMTMDSEQSLEHLSKSENMSKQTARDLLHPEKEHVLEQGGDMNSRQRVEDVPHGQAEFFLREIEHTSKQGEDLTTKRGVDNVAMTTF